MKWISLNDIREKYLSFFESKGHLRQPSYPLIPKDDKSLLLINAGMAPLKKFFTGEVTPPRKRMTTCQKCIRVIDIENVGKTARHGTFFEMLGNFSFGDYFKREAIAWAWEFLTKELEIPEDRLWVSVYLDDEEENDIWANEVGVPRERIVRLGKEDNFWEIETGPCGPCSEIHFDRGPEYGCDSPDCGVGCDCDRYVEVWNLVFTQFNKDAAGNYTLLAHPNIDTGMGLERISCVMQGVNSLFEVDTVRKILDHAARIAGVSYGEKPAADISLRIITDHIRSTVFMVGDGVIPSNEGRGYVLRRLLRRAARHGKLLGISGPFLAGLCDTVIAENLTAYPDLASKSAYIKKVILNEEESFARTIDAGLGMLADMITEMRAEGRTVLRGEDAFKLYDTYGFPLDLTEDVLQDAGFTVDADVFAEKMDAQRRRARAARENLSAAGGWDSTGLALENVHPTKFTGYESLQGASSVAAIVAEGEQTGALDAGQSGIVVTDETPFYAESGGQVGDRGVIRAGAALFEVTDTQKNAEGVYYHIGTLREGRIEVGDGVELAVDGARRQAIARNHSSLHLLQAALRRVLGEHVEQAGSYVDEKRGRLDFTHFSAMTPEELTRVERMVNEQILSGLPVDVRMMPIDEARASGAMALFSEKYGDVVRVVSMGAFSRELCGGTHLTDTSRMGLFKIVSESSVAAGVRRIECVTGFGENERIDTADCILRQAARILKSSTAEVADRAGALHEELRAAQKEIAALNQKLAALQIGGIVDGAKQVGPVRLALAKPAGMAADALRTVGDLIKEQYPDIVAVLAVVNEGRINFLCACGRDAVKAGAHAGNLIRKLAELTGGRGGGRPDTALAGGKDPAKLDTALAAAESALLEMVR